MVRTKASQPGSRMLLLLALLAALALTLWLFPQGDRVQDMAFDAAGKVEATLGDENAIVQILFRPEGGEVYAVDLAENCRVVDGRGKVSAYRLPQRQIKVHYAPEEKWRTPSQPMADLIFVLPEGTN